MAGTLLGVWPAFSAIAVLSIPVASTTHPMRIVFPPVHIVYRKLVSVLTKPLSRIPSVLLVGALRKVIRVAARWILTNMVDDQSSIDIPLECNPSSLMRPYCFPIPTKHSVTLFISVTNPLPASIDKLVGSPIDLLGKGFFFHAIGCIRIFLAVKH